MGPSRREFLAQGAALATLAAGCAPRPTGGKSPNILFILTDDQGYGDLACYGAPDLRTPVADRLAAEDVRFTQYYAAAPECTPTRTAFMTGRYLQRVGGLECAIGTTNVGRYDDAIRLAERHELGLPVQETSIATLLDRAGYASAIYGKWHLAHRPAETHRVGLRPRDRPGREKRPLEGPPGGGPSSQGPPGRLGASGPPHPRPQDLTGRRLPCSREKGGASVQRFDTKCRLLHALSQAFETRAALASRERGPIVRWCRPTAAADHSVERGAWRGGRGTC